MCFLNGFHLISPAFLTGSRNAGRSQYAVNCRDDDNDPDPEEVDSHPLTTFTVSPVQDLGMPFSTLCISSLHIPYSMSSPCNKQYGIRLLWREICAL